MTANEFALKMGKAAGAELDDCLVTIKHCLEQLTEDQVWFRSQPDSTPPMNSIGNLMLHLHGNARQWLVAGLDGMPHVRDRPKEFAENGPISKSDLLLMLQQVVKDAKKTLGKQTAKRLLEKRRPQTRVVTGLGTIFHSVPHFRGHTQEIIHITRTLLGSKYQIKLPSSKLV